VAIAFYLHPKNSTMCTCSFYISSFFRELCSHYQQNNGRKAYHHVSLIPTFVHITNFVEIGKKPFMDRRTYTETGIIKSTRRNSTKNTLKLTYNTTWNILLSPETVQYTHRHAIHRHRSIHCNCYTVLRKKTPTQFLSYLDDWCIDLNKNCSEYT